MKVERSFDDKDIVKINYKNREVYLGSKYNMTREIENLRESLKGVNKKFKIIIFGIAGGAFIKDLKEDFQELDILIIEPLNELKELVESNIKNFNEDIKVISMEDKEFRNNMKENANKRFIEFKVFSNYDLVFPNEVYEFKKYIDEMLLNKMVDDGTKLCFSKEWVDNYLGNIDKIIKSENLNHYKNVFQDKPVIIVAAGPSLEKNLHLLKGNEDKFIIITGIRTLRTLKNAGIKCDFACVIDGSEVMYEVAREALNEEVPLFFQETANKKIIEEYSGKKIYFTAPIYKELNTKLFNFNTDPLFQGGSVSHSCLAIANYMGCNPIIFIGQDLAYTNNQMHAAGATIKGEELESNFFHLYVDDINGNKVPTTYPLNTFRKSFEEFIKYYDDKVYINATEGGANMEGTLVRTLKEVINENKEIIDKSYIGKQKESNFDVKSIIKGLKEHLSEIKELKKFAEEGVRENKSLTQKYLSNNKEFKKSLDRLDYLDKKLNERGEAFLLLNFLLFPVIREIDIAFYDEKIENFESELEYIKFISEKGAQLYSNISYHIVNIISDIENEIKLLEEIDSGK